MQNEKNLTPEEVRSVITSRERKLTPAQIKSLLTTQLQSMGFTPDTAPDDVYYKACASIVRRILKEVGFENVFVVPEQEKPDPDFTTVGAASRPTICAWSFCWAAP